MASLSDMEFQNDSTALRVAPWLDIVALRAEMKVKLLEAISPSGSMRRCFSEFRDDIQEFCEGKRSRIPRSYETKTLVFKVTSRLFPAATTDRRRARSARCIYGHLRQVDDWSIRRRGLEATEDEDSREEVPF